MTTHKKVGRCVVWPRNSDILQKRMTQEREWWISLFSSWFHICVHLPHCPVWFGPPLLVEPEQCAADLVESEGHRWMMTSLKCKLHRGDESQYLQSSVFFHTSHHFFLQFICILWIIVLRNLPGLILMTHYSSKYCTCWALWKVWYCVCAELWMLFCSGRHDLFCSLTSIAAPHWKRS